MKDEKHMGFMSEHIFILRMRVPDDTSVACGYSYRDRFQEAAFILLHVSHEICRRPIYTVVLLSIK